MVQRSKVKERMYHGRKNQITRNTILLKNSFQDNKFHREQYCGVLLKKSQSKSYHRLSHVYQDKVDEILVSFRTQ